MKNEDLYCLSQRIINSENNRETCNISYTDIYDFSAKKQNLKKWENELDIRLQELRLPSL